MDGRSMKFKIIAYTILFIIAAVIIEINILNYANKKQVFKTSQIILDRVEGVITENEKTEKELLSELKTSYIDKANAVAYLLDRSENAEDNIDELFRIARLLRIDEINLFNETGVIYGGTNPEYYGINFDSGEQISFFKPMLYDRSLSKCQDLVPNSAEGKSMMYAAVWNQYQSYIVQIGIEPRRLLKELNENDIAEVIKKMPVYDGVNIYVADIKTGEILGTTDEPSIGKTLLECGFIAGGDDISTLSFKSVHLDGFRNYCSFRQTKDFCIGVVHSTRANLSSFIISISIVLVLLIVSGGILIFTLLRLANAHKRITNQVSMLSSIADIYYSMHLIDLFDLTIEELEGNELMNKIIREGKNASDIVEKIVRMSVREDLIDVCLEFVDLSTLRERMQGRQSLSLDTVDKNVGWLRMTFISVETDLEGMPKKVIMATEIIDEEKKREEQLSLEMQIDELTGLYNRRAYENDLMIYPNVPPEKDFVYAAIDLNELKYVNDSLGHVAGDELIKGAAKCLTRTFGAYGKVFRTGGDEFVSIFFADEEHLKIIAEDIEKQANAWRSEEFPSALLSLSVGYVTKREAPDKTVAQIAEMADERMYDAKAKYYAEKGFDRRKRATAHTALCKLYTKILKINLTTDNYIIVDMDVMEKTADKGFSDKISEWLQGFGKSGQVHPDDLEEYLRKTNVGYLREYFDGSKNSISIFYRRKYESGYKEVIMEMIPADDFRPDNQSLFLYVKTIDK